MVRHGRSLEFCAFSEQKAGRSHATPPQCARLGIDEPRIEKKGSYLTRTGTVLLLFQESLYGNRRQRAKVRCSTLLEGPHVYAWKNPCFTPIPNSTAT